MNGVCQVAGTRFPVENEMEGAREEGSERDGREREQERGRVRENKRGGERERERATGERTFI